MLRFLFILVLSSPLLLSAAESMDERSLLLSMSRALHQVNYKGTFTYRRDDQMQGIEITHGVKGGREFERMVTLNGPAREIVRDDEQVRCEFQQADPFMVEESSYPRPFVFSDPEQLTQLEQYYEISSEPSEPIAGFSSRKILLQPSDHYRYGYRFWVSSSEPHLLLRSEMVAENGAILEQLLFTSLQILESAPAEFDAITALSQRSEPSKMSSEPPHFSWRVSRLPPGYRHETERFSNMMTNDTASQQVEHHLYSDGFSSVSLFIEMMSGNRDKFQPIASQMGAVSLVSYLNDAHKIVVVGEVPLATAELIAHSIERIE
ncbi:MAG: MucB/RseB C-terminal domain-containing protein [Gammaproteobacteria bacterium]|nr:MucB/RseB C-terminal domain-containing protein [Gammaproteobacteria bacterium]